MNKESKPYFIYPKDKDGNYSKQTICIIYRDGRPFEGTALCHEDDEFNKKVGRALALERAEAAYKKVSSNFQRAGKKPAQRKVVKVAHYLSIADKTKYPNDVDTIYKVRTKTDNGLHTIEVGASELDNNWTSPGKMYVRLAEDGNGILVSSLSLSEPQEFYLDYSMAHDLHLGLQKWHRLQKSAKFKRLK